MDYIDFAKKIKEQDESLEICGGVLKHQIDEAEQKLGILFPNEYVKFLLECGSCGYPDTYISGLFQTWDNMTSRGSTLSDTLNARQLHKLPNDYIVLEYMDLNNYYLLKVDAETRLKDSEVFSIDIDSDGNLKKFHKVFDSFEDYFKHSIEIFE